MILVIKAISFNKDKRSKEEIIAVVEDRKEKIKAFILPKKLENLTKYGRIGKARSLTANMLDMKPILTSDRHGEITMFKVVKSWKYKKREVIQSMENKTEANKIYRP